MRLERVGNLTPYLPRRKGRIQLLRQTALSKLRIKTKMFFDIKRQLPVKVFRASSLIVLVLYRNTITLYIQAMLHWFDQ